MLTNMLQHVYLPCERSLLAQRRTHPSLANMELDHHRHVPIDRMSFLVRVEPAEFRTKKKKVTYSTTSLAMNSGVQPPITPMEEERPMTGITVESRCSMISRYNTVDTVLAEGRTLYLASL